MITALAGLAVYNMVFFIKKLFYWKFVLCSNGAGAVPTTLGSTSQAHMSRAKGFMQILLFTSTDYARALLVAYVYVALFR